MAAVGYDVVLGPTDFLPGRAFAAAGWTGRDAQLMERLLRRQRQVVRAKIDGGAVGEALWERSLRGRRHWLSVPDLAALAAARDVTVVGFFGQARQDVDHAILFELERAVAATFVTYARFGLLGYYDAEFGDKTHRYGNLILFATPEVPKEWYRNPAHEQSVAIAREHYLSIRLHSGRIPGPFLGSGAVAIERTKYFDYQSEPLWRGLRVFTDAAAPPAAAVQRP